MLDEKNQYCEWSWHYPSVWDQLVIVVEICYKSCLMTWFVIVNESLTTTATSEIKGWYNESNFFYCSPVIQPENPFQRKVRYSMLGCNIYGQCNEYVLKWCYVFFFSRAAPPQEREVITVDDESRAGSSNQERYSLIRFYIRGCTRKKQNLTACNITTFVKWIVSIQWQCQK